MEIGARKNMIKIWQLKTTSNEEMLSGNSAEKKEGDGWGDFSRRELHTLPQPGAAIPF